MNSEILKYIEKNIQAIDGLMIMMDKVVEGMIDLTYRIEQLEKKSKEEDKKDIEKYGECPLCQFPSNRCKCIEWGP
jgi:hypothetical protein